MRSILRVIQGWVKIKGNDDGTPIGNIDEYLKVHPHEEDQYRLEKGDAYYAIDGAIMANNQVQEFAFTAPASGKSIIMFGEVVSSALLEIDFWGGVTEVTGGQQAGGYNRNHNSTNQSQLAVVINPTSYNTATATKYEKHYIGTGGGKFGGTVAANKFMLKANTTYVLKIRSTANSNSVTWKVYWYDVEFWSA